MRFERCLNPVFIPRHLLEQLPNKEFNPESFYTFMQVALQSPTQLLYLLMNDENVIKGFLWCEINLLEKVMFINILSVDKELWGAGEMVKFASDFLKELFDKLELNKALWITDRPALFENFGFKRSKEVLLEYTGKEEKPWAEQVEV